MMALQQPLWLLLVPLWLLLAWCWRRRPAAVRFPTLSILQRAASPARFSLDRRLFVVQTLGVVCLAVALARPQTFEGRTSLRSSGIDIVLVVDLSLSMRALDFATRENIVTRLDVVRDVLRYFVAQRPQDRLGLVAFAEDAYLLSPLTLDHAWVQRNLDRMQLNLIPGNRTAIGPAIAMATNRLRDLPDAKSRVIILLTDGENNVTSLPPLAAANAAASIGARIYTIGVGRHGEVLIPQIDDNGQVLYRRGQPWIIDRIYNQFDTKELEEIARITDGRFFRATDAAELRRIYEEIDRLERTEVELDAYSVAQEWYAVPATLALLFLAAHYTLSRTCWLRLP